MMLRALGYVGNFEDIDSEIEENILLIKNYKIHKHNSSHLRLYEKMMNN